MTVKELKRGDYFTLKPLEQPRDSQVYVRGDYDRTTRKYCACKFDDISAERLLNGDREIYTDFIF